MNILQSNNLVELSKTTKVTKKSYFVALLILATIAIVNYFVMSQVMKAQARVSELTAQVVENELQYRRIKELIQLDLTKQTNKENYLLHKSIRLELKGLVKKLRQNRIKIEEIIAIPRWQQSIPMGFPEIVTEPINLLPSHSKVIESQLEQFILLDGTIIKWYFSIWAPLSLKLSENGVVLENVKKVLRELRQKATVITERSVNIHHILTFSTLFTLLLEYLFIFHPLLQLLSISYKKIEGINSELKYRATHDDMTNMGNRQLFIATLEQEKEKSFTLFLVDLRDFKNINDVHGITVGDHVLCILASRLRTLISNKNNLFRLDGDQFVIIAYNLGSGIQVEQLAHQLISSVAKPINFNGKIILMHCAIGINSVDPLKDDINTEQVLKQLDFSLRAAKASEQLCFYIFNTGDNKQNISKAQLSARISDALNNGEILPFYQPIINMESGEIIGAEALARWVSEENGISSPGEFLPILEELALMSTLTEIMLEQVCSDHKKLVAAGINSKFISVNFPECFLSDPELLIKIRAIMGHEKIDYLHVEILETVLLQDSSQIIKDNLHALIEIGVHISMDDFGTGYASLSHLLKVPCHTIKIDRCFVANLPSDSGSELIIRGIIDIALGLELDLIAEGIETNEQKKFFSEWPEIAGQGYLFHRPQPFSSFIDLLRGNKNAI